MGRIPFLSPGRGLNEGANVDDVRGNMLLLLGGVANELPRTPQHHLVSLISQQNRQSLGSG